MSRLRRRETDQGIVAIIVALLFSTGIMFALMALVADLGMLRIERAELRRAADSAAVSAAYDCSFLPLAVSNPPSSNTAVSNNCGTATYSGAYALVSPTGMSNRNSADGMGEVAELCGNVPAKPSIPACPPATGVKDCVTTPNPSDPSFSTNPNRFFVRVTVRSKTSYGDRIAPVFGRVIPGYNSVSLTACSWAAWSPPKQIAAPSPGIAFAVSERCWQLQTSRAAYPPPYPYTTAQVDSLAPAFQRALVVVAVKTTYNPPNTPPNESCYAGAGDTTLAGGFGWLQTCSTNMKLDSSGTLLLEGKDGISASGGQQEALCADRFINSHRKLVYVPVYDRVVKDATTNVSYFRVKGFAPFFLSGWNNLPSMTTRDPVTAGVDGKTLCTNEKCIYGWFTQSTLLQPQGAQIDPTQPNFGLNVVKLGG